MQEVFLRSGPCGRFTQGRTASLTSVKGWRGPPFAEAPLQGGDVDLAVDPAGAPEPSAPYSAPTAKAASLARSAIVTLSRSTVTPSGASLPSAREKLSGFMPRRAAISNFS
jgi:hypothetical protein